MTKSEDIRSWYNHFSKLQEKTGTNLRHFKILYFLMRAGLKPHHTLLEIGSGVGIMTARLQKYLCKGKIVATDISDISIEKARKRVYRASNVEFIVTDMQNFDYPMKFDFVLLPDVLEHIPINRHADLFRILKAHMHESSILIIHIPHPKATDYYRAFDPKKLQIIDQSLQADQLMKDAYANDLILIDYQSYSLYHNENDYIFIRFRSAKDVTYKPISKFQIIMKKFAHRICYLLYIFRQKFA